MFGQRRIPTLALLGASLALLATPVAAQSPTAATQASTPAAQVSAPVLLEVRSPDLDRWRDHLPEESPPPRPFARSAVDALRDVEATLAQIDAAMENFEEAQALALLELAEERIRPALSLPSAGDWLGELSLRRALLLIDAGDEDAAQIAFSEARRWSKNRPLSRGEASPAAHAAFAAAPIEGPLHPWRLSETPPQTTVWIDGTLSNPPLTLPAGRHWIRATAPGHRPFGALVDVAGEGHLEINLEPTPWRAAQGAIATAASPDQARLALPQGHVLVWLQEQSPSHAIVSRCDRNHCESEHLRLAEAVLPTAATPARPFYRHWAFWTASAAALIGGTILIGIAAQPDPEQRLRVRITPEL